MRLLRSAAALLLLFGSRGFCQTITTLNLSTQSRSPDFSNFPITKPITVGSALPLTCQVGQMFFNTGAAAGQNIYGCTQPNTWAQFGALPVANSATVGGVIVPANSGLLVSSGALTVAYGTGSNTALQGNTLGQANGPASLDSTGKVPVAQLRNLGSAAFLNSTAFDVAGAGTAAVSGIPQSGLNVTQPALIRPADWALFNNKQSSLGFVPENPGNKNAANGYAGLDPSGLFPWVQLSGVPIASGTRAGVLSASDWSSFNSKQAPLGFTPENLANRGQVGGYASLNSSGQVPTTQLPIIPSKTSQLTNDAAFVNATQAKSAAPVQSVNGQIGVVSFPVPTQVSQLGNDSGYVTASTAPVKSVNGQTGAVTIQSGNYQTVAVNSANQTQAPAVNLKAGANVIVSGTYNSATSSTDVTISASSGSGGSVGSGAALPTANSCSSTTVGAMYAQTGNNNNSGASNFFICGNSGSSYRWMLLTGHQVNVMNFGCKADGSVDDQPCFQAAVNFATALNSYATNPFGSVVYVPCGNYAVANPIILPRTGGYAYRAVGLTGEDRGCTELTTLSTFPANRSMIEWSQAYVSGQMRSVNQTIKNFTFNSSNANGGGAVHYQYTSQDSPTTMGSGASSVNLTNQRLTIDMENVDIWGANNRNPYDIYVEGDCFKCSFRNINGSPSAGAATTFDTVTILTDACVDSTGSTITDEMCGIQFGSIENVYGGFNHGGYSSPFQGRVMNTSVKNIICNGVWGGEGNPWATSATPGHGGSQCLAFVNSINSTMENTADEGSGAQPGILFYNSYFNKYTDFGLGSARNWGGLGDGMSLISSSYNVFENHYACCSSYNGVSSSIVALRLDASSHNNRFINVEFYGAADISVADLATNLLQWGDVSGSNSPPLQMMGYMPGFLSVVPVPASSSSVCTRGQVAYSNTYQYYCSNTNTWVRTALGTF